MSTAIVQLPHGRKRKSRGREKLREKGVRAESPPQAKWSPTMVKKKGPNHGEEKGKVQGNLATTAEGSQAPHPSKQTTGAAAGRGETARCQSLLMVENWS